MKHRRSRLPVTLQFTLFVSSYIPLFVIIMCKQTSINFEYLHFGGISTESIQLCVTKFGISGMLLLVSVFGAIGLIFFKKSMKIAAVENGYDFRVDKIHNKNNESIGYIATYLVPFVFQSFSGAFEIISFVLLMSVMYVIYIHSTLIVVNPVLNLLSYSLYDIEYTDIKSKQQNSLTGTFIVDSHYLEQNDIITVKSLGMNLYYAVLKGEGYE